MEMTTRHRALLDFLVSEARAKGLRPRRKTLCDLLGIGADHVSHLVLELERMGYVRSVGVGNAMQYEYPKHGNLRTRPDSWVWRHMDPQRGGGMQREHRCALRIRGMLRHRARHDPGRTGELLTWPS